MKRGKKLLSLLGALLLALSMTFTGFAATIAIESDSSAINVSGKTFQAYRILELKVETVGEKESYLYSVPESMKDFYADYFKLDKTATGFDQQVVEKIAGLDDNSTELLSFADAALAAAKRASISPVSSQESNGSVTIDVENNLGYYVIENVKTADVVSSLLLESVGENLTVKLKADAPTIDKQIEETAEDGTTSLNETNSVSVGDTVNFKLTSHVPDMSGYSTYTYYVTDTLSGGLTFNNDVKIMVGETPLQNTDYTVKTEPANPDNEPVKLTIDLGDLKKLFANSDDVGKTITITYSATLNDHAVIGTEGNSNSAALTYSNNPNDAAQTQTTPEKKTYTYTTGIKLTKVDQDGKVLSGAKFTLEGTGINKVATVTYTYTEDPAGSYYLLKTGTYTTTPPKDETKDNYAEGTPRYNQTKALDWKEYKTDKKVTGTVNNYGLLEFDGLAAGEYTITEMEAPSGYHILAHPIELTITCTEPTDPDVDANCTWKVAATYAGANLDESKVTVEDGIINLTVENATGTELPSTGGMGTTLFYIIGSVMVIGAAVLLIVKKRMSAEDTK